MSKPSFLPSFSKIFKMKRIVFLLVVAIVLAGQAVAQTGKIAGKIIDKKNGEDLIGASVLIMGTSKGSATDIFGSFEIPNVEPGTYSLQVRYISYKTIEIQDVTVEPGKTATVNISMETDDGLKLDEVVVKSSRVTNTESAVLIETKKADMVVTAVSAAQIAKSQDRDAADVARRIPGVTVIDNRFVIVRGLTERYNAVLLNNAFAPSVEPDVKAFSFDFVPSSMIDRFMVYKSPSPDLPGEFAGGAIKIFTKNIPEKTGVQLSYQTSFRQGTTFRDFSLNPGSSTDWLGFDNGMRDLPAGFPANVRDVPTEDTASLDALGRSLKNNWGYETKSAMPDHRAGVTINGVKQLPKFKFGNITSISYTSTSIFTPSTRSDFNAYDVITQSSDTVFHYNDDIFMKRAKVGVLQNNAFSLGKDGDHKIELKNIFSQDGINETTLRSGRNFEEGTYRQEYSYRYKQRTIYSGQLSGNHEFETSQTKFDWTGGYSMGKSTDPDWRRARYTKDVAAGPDDPYTAYVPFSAQPFYLGRLYFNTDEDIFMGSFNLEQRFRSKKHEKFVPGLKAGSYIEKKNREFSVRNIGYAMGNFSSFDYSIAEQPIDQIFAPENINSVTGLKIDEDTKGSDSYDASNFLRAYYGMVMLPLWKFNITGGVRIEHNTQDLNSYDITGAPINVNNDIVSVLPSANVAFNIHERMLVRAAYGKTVNRPEFREIAPFYFYDFVFNAINLGNSNLNIAQVHNVDLRWEFYPTQAEVISIGAFYKRFEDPIEKYFMPGVGSGGTRSFTWGNAYTANNYGIEVEIRKTFAKLAPNVRFLRDLGVVANGAWIESRVQLSKNSSTEDNERPMMGQSPYVINTGVYYQNDSINLSANILYNVIGPRIVIVGVPGIPEVWEMPRNTLDFTISKGIGKHFDIRLSVQNILNAKYMLLQDANVDGDLDRHNDQSMQSFRVGQYYTVGVSYKL